MTEWSGIILEWARVVFIPSPFDILPFLASFFWALKIPRKHWYAFWTIWIAIFAALALWMFFSPPSGEGDMFLSIVLFGIAPKLMIITAIGRWLGHWRRKYLEQRLMEGIRD